MLLWFSVTNFRSIRERQFLSLVAGGDGHLRDRNVLPCVEGHIATGPQGLKSAVVYGANASGKSTLFMALQAFQTLVLHSATSFQHGQPLPVAPFLLSGASRAEPSEFEVAFVAPDGVRYEYGCSLTATRVLREWLVAYPLGRAQRWFVRDHVAEQSRQFQDRVADQVAESAPNPLPQWKFSTHFQGDAAQRKLWQNATRDNALFLSTAVQFNNTQLLPVFNWFGERLIVVTPQAQMNPWLSIELLQSAEGRELVMDLIQAADLGIVQLEVVEDTFEPIPDNAPLRQGQLRIRLEAPEAAGLQQVQLRSAKVRAWHKTDDNAEISFDLTQESDGTRKLFEYAGGIIHGLQRGATLCIDELDRSLHPHLTRFLIDLFHGPANTRGAQLVFSTHDTTLMDQDLLRRDQIWFTSKTAEGSTELYPLSDYSPRKGEALERGYLKGRYGAVPIVGQIREIG